MSGKNAGELNPVPHSPSHTIVQMKMGEEKILNTCDTYLHNPSVNGYISFLCPERVASEMISPPAHMNQFFQWLSHFLAFFIHRMAKRENDFQFEFIRHLQMGAECLRMRGRVGDSGNSPFLQCQEKITDGKPR